MDLETALHRVIGFSDNCNLKREFISPRKWISFRVAHSRDASSIASFYQTKQDNRSDEIKSDMCHDGAIKPNDDAVAMELRLAQGLGDEDTLPSVFAILVDIYENGADDDALQFTTNLAAPGIDRNEKSSNLISSLAAAALITVEWQNRQRVLRVEWSKVDGNLKERDIVHRRLWFRLSTVALLLSCQLMKRSTEEKTPQFRSKSTLM